MEIERPDNGDLYRNFGLVITKNGEKVSSQSNYEIRIQKRKLTREDADKLFEQAKEEIAVNFIGENVTADEIKGDVNLQNSYVNGEVEVEWSFDDYSYLSLDGTYNRDAAKSIPEEGEIVRVTAKLSMQEYESEYSFCVKVIQPEITLEESIETEIQRIVNANTETKQIVLPEEVVVENETYSLQWSDSKMDSPIFMAIAILVLIVLIRYEIKEKRCRTEEKRKRKLQMEYPEIVSEFALLLGAGMNIRTVLKEVSKDGRHEVISRVLMDIENGYSEYQAFYRMADTCDMKCYRRFASLITQNIMLGGKHLSKMLIKESERAYDERKNIAVKMGEEAGTKMMIPMLMMLAIVLTVTILPAFFSMNI